MSVEVWGIPIMADVEDIIENLRNELHAEGIPLLKDKKLTANNVMVTCIAHGDGQEKKPSLGISTVDVKRGNRIIPAGTCNCFTCGYVADLATFISDCQGKNDKGMMGYKWLTQNFVNLSVEKRKPIELSFGEEDLADMLEEVIGEETLEKFRFTHSYMYERRLTDKVIDYFDIGYDAEKQALTFPVSDKWGDVKLIQRRSVNSKQFINDEGGNKGNHVFGLYQVYQNISWIKEIYVTESPIDALTLWAVRKPAVALMGARITERQAELLRELPIRKIISALDNDKAGNEGHVKLSRMLTNKVLYRYEFPFDKKDINELPQEWLEAEHYHL